MRFAACNVNVCNITVSPADNCLIFYYCIIAVLLLMSNVAWEFIVAQFRCSLVAAAFSLGELARLGFIRQLNRNDGQYSFPILLY